MSFSQGLKLFNQKKYKQALPFLKKSAQQSSPVQIQSAFYTGFALHKLNQNKKAIEWLERVLSFDSSESKWIVNSLLLKWKILLTQKSKNTYDKISTLSQLIQQSSSIEIKTKAREIALSLIQNLTLSKLKKFYKDSSLAGVKDVLLFHIGREYVKEKHYQKALSYFKQLISTAEDSSIEEKTRQYISALTFRTKIQPKTIAVILPLTGKYEKIGRRCLHGLQLGLGLYSKKPSSFKLVVVDSKGTSLSIQEDIKKILLEHHAIGLVGGVVSQSAVKLAMTAQNFMIPAILLSQKSKLTQTGSFIFQNAVTHEHIIDNLTDTLINKLNHKKLAILYPNDPFGVEYANLFWDYALAKGGEITAVQTYKPGETDFNNSIRRLTGSYYYEGRDEEFRSLLTQWFAVNNKINKKQLKEILPPIVNFSSIFIPDSVKSLHNITPYFNVQNIKNITLAGPSLWNSQRLLKQKKEFVEGAVFVDTMITNHPQFKKSPFFKTFKNVFNYSPGSFEFLAYQSALALRQVLSSGIKTREELKNRLVQLGELSSPIGKIKISKNREFIYPMTHFSVKNSAITPL